MSSTDNNIDVNAKIKINQEAVLGVHELKELAFGPVQLIGLDKLADIKNKEFKLNIEKIQELR